MKLLLVLLLSFTSVSVLAENHEKGKSFEENKAIFISHLDKRIGHLNEAKVCASAATTKEALKACRKNLKAQSKAMKAERQKHKNNKKSK
jgi:glycyl-tRNA synthetase beta subunit